LDSKVDGVVPQTQHINLCMAFPAGREPGAVRNYPIQFRFLFKILHVPFKISYSIRKMPLPFNGKMHIENVLCPIHLLFNTEISPGKSPFQYGKRFRQVENLVLCDGRVPNTKDLNLEAAGVDLSDQNVCPRLQFRFLFKTLYAQFRFLFFFKKTLKISYSIRKMLCDGRVPNTKDLNLEAAGVDLSDQKSAPAT